MNSENCETSKDTFKELDIAEVKGEIEDGHNLYRWTTTVLFTVPGRIGMSVSSIQNSQVRTKSWQ